MQSVRNQFELQSQKKKLAHSYQQLLEEFAASDLRSVGNYTLGRLIGKGSFGKVFLATHKLTNGSKVVLKSANKDDANLAREIHHHRQFIHPHIARLYEVIVTESLVWLVLEYCPGDELYNYLFQHGALPLEKAQKIFAQLVGAVAYVHKQQCVHRDLKLENILLDKHENVKLVDFGFTREYEPKLSHLQTFCGTVCYSAPEMLKGEKYAGERVDVWSLGIILYALLTGELPFDEDDELATKHKILNADPKYPDTLNPEAKALLTRLLSRRPLLRPTLAEILTDPFLAEHAENQRAILNVVRPAPFTTPLEQDVILRMRSAGVDVDAVVENVLAQRCDALAGWWALLIEKEERKERRRERKRRERELEGRAARRTSGTSSRRTSGIYDLDERSNDHSRPRGRRDRRSLTTPQLIIRELPQLPEGRPPVSTPPPPPPIEKDSVRSLSSTTSRPRPPLPPKERDRRRSRTSTLQLVGGNPELLAPPAAAPKRRGIRRPAVLFHQLVSIKHWFVESTKRSKSPGNTNKSDASTIKTPGNKSPGDPTRTPASQRESRTTPGNATQQVPAKPQIKSRQSQPGKPHQQTHQQPSSHGSSSHPPRIQPPLSRYSQHRNSLSPGPLTPHSSTYRHSSAGLRGRKSTSSSVSSIRSIHHVHSHSKASSTSSTSNSVVSAALAASKVGGHTRSPRDSIKVLPVTPTANAFPSNMRLVRNGPSPLTIDLSGTAFTEASLTGTQPSPGLVFAKRKKTPFRGPNLHIPPSSSTNAAGGGSSYFGNLTYGAFGSGSGGGSGGFGSMGGGGALGTRSRDHSTGSHRSQSGQRRRSGQTIAEEDETEVEEVDAFSPVAAGEFVETILEAPDPSTANTSPFPNRPSPLGPDGLADPFRGSGRVSPASTPTGMRTPSAAGPRTPPGHGTGTFAGSGTAGNGAGGGGGGGGGGSGFARSNTPSVSGLSPLPTPSSLGPARSGSHLRNYFDVSGLLSSVASEERSPSRVS